MVNLVYLTPNSTDLIAYASRFSTATQEVNLEEQITKEEMNEKLVKKLIDREHFSCLEFADAIFEIKGSRSMLAQITRHRLLSFVVKSQRYCKEDSSIFIIPPEFRKSEDMERFYIKCVARSQEDYNTLIKHGAKKEDARFILPNACETHLIVKGNFRSWMEFFTLRCDKHAQWEIRQIAGEMRDILKKETFVFQYLYGG